MIVRLNCFANLFLKFSVSVPLLLLSASFAPSLSFSQDASFHNAPASTKTDKNPYAGKADAVTAGKTVFSNSCITCHGASGQGSGNVPPLAHGPVQTAS